MIVEKGLLILIAGIAVLMDLHRMRVENSWIVAALLAGMLFQVYTQGFPGIGRFLTGAVFPVMVLGILFYFRMLGAGDIKLFCALGGIMGIETIGTCMIISFILGAVFSLFFLIFYGDFHQRIQYFINYFQDYFSTGKLRPYYKKGMALENFHFTVPVFLSVLLYAGGVY